MARIAGIDLPPNKQIWIGLTYIHGIGRAMSKDILARTEVVEADTPGGVESTILGVEGGHTLVYREGLYQVPDTLPRKVAMEDGANANTAPGMMTSHYAPKGTLRMNVTDPAPGDWYIGFGRCEGCDANLSPRGDLREAAANLFALLHEADERDSIAVAPIPDTDLGRAINDRLRRAAAPR